MANVDVDNIMAQNINSVKLQTKQRASSGRRFQNFKDQNKVNEINSRYTRQGPKGPSVVDSEGAKLRKQIEERKRKQKVEEAKEEIAMYKDAKQTQKETMKKISADYKSVEKMNAKQKQVNKNSTTG